MKTTITEIIEEFKTRETKVLVVESAFDKVLLLNKLDERDKKCYGSKIFTYEHLKTLLYKGQVFNLIVDKEVVDKHKEELTKLLTFSIGWHMYKIVYMDYTIEISNLSNITLKTPNNTLVTKLTNYGCIKLTRKDIIDKIYYNEDKGTTVVLFKDGTKEKCSTMNGEVFDLEVGVLQCLIKKLYGNRSAWLKELDLNNKAVKCYSKDSKKRSLNGFLDGKFVIHCENQKEAIKLTEMLKEKDICWISGRKLNENNTNWSIYRDKTCYNLDFVYNSRDNEGVKLSGLQFADTNYYEQNNMEIVKFKDIVG